MPSDIEEVLAGAKLALLPVSYEELRADCSCPDEANPCKHTAAAYYVLAEHLDGDPFALFTLRGRTQQELLQSLRARRMKAAGGLSVGERAVQQRDAERKTQVPLTQLIDSFWRAGPQLAQLQVSPLASEFPDALPRRLGPLPAAEDGGDLSEPLAPIYAHLAAAAERRALSG
jgi:uncharacterized Zn finger protein